MKLSPDEEWRVTNAKSAIKRDQETITSLQVRIVCHNEELKRLLEKRDNNSCPNCGYKLEHNYER